MRVLLALGLALAVLALGFGAGVNAQTCIDENGAPVDWFVIVKLPRLKASSDSGVQTGIGYIYGDANSYSNPSAFWSASQHTVADASSSVGATVSQIYAQASNSSVGYVMYNDELPVTSMTYGHTKGHIAWSQDSGFWLVHSVPKFANAPASTSSYAYPPTGEEFGQSMLCVTLNTTMIDTAFLQFQLTNPQVYAKQWVPELNDLMPNGNAFVNSGTVNMASASNQVVIETINGFAFTHFAKTTAWGQSIYGNLIGPAYSTGMVAETWQRPYETPLLPPTTQEAVYSVRTLSVPSYITAFGTATWKESEDHAKWALAEIGSSLPLFCVGDINKQVTQWKRSGGMMCILDVTLHQAFLALVTSTDQNSDMAAQPAVKESANTALL